MSLLRFNAVEEAAKRKPVTAHKENRSVGDYFAEAVFDRKTMQKYLSNEVYKKLSQHIDNGQPIDRDIADSVAAGMRMWASNQGVTHYTHWFQPLTDGTAEKHDAFATPDGNGGMIEELSGKLLTQQEPDASSFPNGGLRNTFEARGYSAWDPSSPAFIVDDTLCIPTVFIAYTGEALDYKTPLLRSLEALEKASTRVARFFYPEVNRCTTFLGWEQEYFLVDEALFVARPDLRLTGRTLMGHESAKNQQLDDHYFGSIPERVQEFMKDLEIECYRLGIPLKTRHNEVAPNQFELAPIYEECNLANDHNVLLMSTMKRVASHHHFRILLHEKPFDGVNGSGKHCNWSIGTDTGVNLFSPGKNSTDNLRFICFMAVTLMAVYKNDALLKASIASATNAHRLGGHEAPPSIISTFLGTEVSAILNKFMNSKPKDAIQFDAKKGIHLGVGQIPELLLDNTDRNRTSPFAFTGNRFEFRAVGSSANCASAMLALCTALAYQMNDFADHIDGRVKKGESDEEALYHVIREYLQDSEPIHFDGNGYSDEWRIEAERRGLNIDTNVPLLYDSYTTEQSIKIFEATGVLTQAELEARNEVKWEIYTKKVQIESRVLGDLSLNHIVPVATKYQTMLLDNVAKLKDVFPEDEYEKLSEGPKNLISKMSYHLSNVHRMVYEMTEARKIANQIEDLRGRALAYQETVSPYLDQIRYHIDHLELIVDDNMWPLPKYRELLFVQ
ncbi:glutamine synthetase III [Porphyromonas pogonae]|uniref:glutamine synthetase III family protein n=1 Tax=Porphyromonas pogonae TaxID=867595 RepID=UPI002E77658D|nr:glutamine synthetase III [Porphyromonas pogonae]